MEVKRIPNVKSDRDYETNCIVCEKSIWLCHNGGELDQEDCCGYTYRLESPQTDFVITNHKPLRHVRKAQTVEKRYPADVEFQPHEPQVPHQ